jgi:hypothetical protein
MYALILIKKRNKGDTTIPAGVIVMWIRNIM